MAINSSKIKKFGRECDTVAFKASALTPVLENWNAVVTDEHWVTVTNPESGTVKVVETHYAQEKINGRLVEKIASVCLAYQWTWAIYARGEFGLGIAIH